MTTIETTTTKATAASKATTKSKKNNRSTRPRLEPITIVVADQDELRRIHRIAKLQGRPPVQSAKVALRGGTWDTLGAYEKIAANRQLAAVAAKSKSTLGGKIAPSPVETFHKVWLTNSDARRWEQIALFARKTASYFGGRILVTASQLPLSKQAKPLPLAPEGGDRWPVRLTHTELDAIKQSAKECGLPLDVWVYSNLMAGLTANEGGAA